MKKTLILLLAVFSAICLRAQDYFPGANPQPRASAASCTFKP